MRKLRLTKLRWADGHLGKNEETVLHMLVLPYSGHCAPDPHRAVICVWKVEGGRTGRESFCGDGGDRAATPADQRRGVQSPRGLLKFYIPSLPVQCLFPRTQLIWKQVSRGTKYAHTWAHKHPHHTARAEKVTWVFHPAQLSPLQRH